MLKESQLFSLLDRVLSQSAYIRKGEEAVYFCPFCSHYKKKLEINVRTQEWHCWICNSCGKSIRSLFYKLKAKPQYFDELYKIIGTNWKRKNETEKRPQNMSLPDEFLPLWKPQHSSAYGQAMSYLADRKVSMDDILRYNIGYCEEGIYQQRVVVPSYDWNGDINFFAARAYHGGNSYKYMLPPWPKDFTGFELFVNWNELTGITLVEGVFDAMAVRNNAIPLFGTTMQFHLKLNMVIHKVKRVNIVLDNDALKQAIDIFDRIEDLQSSQIDIHLVRLGEKDPSVLGFEATNEMIVKSKPYGFSDIIKAKLDLCR
jgi:DNA primase